ncbi:MAG: class I SAM-dependent methyltransferase [Firmicutes bacterium]|nr:class I SAM-dependent methyltransferase [Bacillota bacterium]
MRCPICSSKDIDVFHDKVWDNENAKVYRCNKCDISFVYPQMTLKEEKEFYLQYKNHVVKRGVISVKSVNELHHKSKLVAEKRYQVIKKFFRGVKSVCEIGSATGAFLELLYDVNYKCAIEPDNENRIYSKKFSQKQYSDISEADKSEQFDIICMFHTFEHIRNPIKCLEWCKSHLASDGKIIIEVPHIKDPLIELYDCKEYKDFYFQMMHPYIYSLYSLTYVADQSDISIIKVIYKQRYGLDNHLNWLNKGKPGGDQYFKELFGNNKQYINSLEKFGLTDTIFIVARSNRI